jgi:glycosyltransferase involved in cell wall biosynthesis
MNKIISIIAPCFNEKDNIYLFYNRVKSIFNDKLKNYEYEVIVVDDCSNDGSIEILEEIAKKDKNFKVILNSRNYGVQVSTFNAIKYVNGDALIPMLPVDMQDTPELIVDFIKKWEEGFDIVYGIKKKREENFILVMLRNIYYKLITKISNESIPPYVGEFQLIDKKIYKELLNFDDYYPYTRGLIATLSSNSCGIDYVWKKRVSGQSKMNLLKLFDMAINGIISFSNFPIRIFTVFGILLTFLSFTFIIIQILSHLLIDGRMETPGISTLIVAVFFFSGVQLLFLGVVGEYVSAIHSQVRKSKKKVVERKKINLI